MRIACRTGRFVVLSLLFTILAVSCCAFAAEDASAPVSAAETEPGASAETPAEGEAAQEDGDAPSRTCRRSGARNCFNLALGYHYRAPGLRRCDVCAALDRRGHRAGVIRRIVVSRCSNGGRSPAA